MPLDPDIQQAIADAVKEQFSMLNETLKPLTEQIEKQQHDNKKLSESLTALSDSIPELLENKFQNIQPSLDFIDEVKKEYEAEEKDSSSDENSNEVNNKLRETILAEVKKEYESKLIGLQSQLDERDEEAKALREADRQLKMKTEVLNTMRGLGTIRPNTEEDLLTLLEKRGLLVEDNDRLFVKTVDKFGDELKNEFKEILPTMLEVDFPHFAAPRGGTGTDGTTGTRSNNSSQYNFEGMSAQEIYDNYGSNEEAQKAMIAELNQIFGKSN